MSQAEGLSEEEQAHGRAFKLFLDRPRVSPTIP